MSGYKKATIVLPEDEFLRLHDAEMELLFARKDLEREKRKQSALRQEVEDSMKDIEKRQQAYRQAIASLSEQVAFTEAQHQAQLMDNREEMLAALMEISTEVAEGQAAILESQEELLQSQFEREIELRQEISAYLLEQSQAAEIRQAEKQATILNWMRAVESQAGFIRTSFQLESDDLDSLARAEASLLYLTESFITINPDAALVIAMQTYQELSGLRSRLEKQELETTLLRATLRQEIQDLVHLFDEHRLIPALDLQGKQISLRIDVDFWTGGRYARARQECMNLLRQLENPSRQIHRQDLASLLNEFLPAQQQQLSALLHQARMEVLRSQLRVETARALVQALAEQGYRLGETGYLSGDQRNSYSLRLIHPTGDDINILISPHEEEELANVLQIAAHAREPITHREMQGRIKEIQTSLSRHGLLVRDFEAAAAPPVKTLQPEVETYPLERQLTRKNA